MTADLSSTPAHRQPTGPPAEPAGRSSGEREDSALGRITGWIVTHRAATVLAWVVLVVAAAAADAAFGSSPSTSFDAPGGESTAAASLVEQEFGARTFDTLEVVWSSDDGVDAPPVRAAMEGLLEEAATLSGIDAVGSPYAPEPGPGARVSADGRVAVAELALDVPAADLPAASARALVDLAAATSSSSLTIGVSGEPVEDAAEASNPAELVGLVAAAVVLLVSFGTVVAAGLPILSALVGLGVGASLTGLVAGFANVPDWGPTIATMIGIGVGIDYALLLVTRFREERAAGVDQRLAVVRTTLTAGHAVLVAGGTVVIALLGLLVVGSSTLSGVAYAASISVAMVLLASVTLVPALLAGPVGRWVDRLPVRRLRPAGGTGTAGPARTSPAPLGAVRRAVQQRPALAAAGGVLVLLALTLPVTGLRLGIPDAGNLPDGTPGRTAYDLVTEGFGAGANGPLVLVTRVDGSDEMAALERLGTALAAEPGVAEVGPVLPNARATAGLLAVVPDGSPQSAATADLVRDLRTSVLPGATDGTGLDVLVGGVTAADIDISDYIAGRVPLFIGGVLALSLLLLTLAFRAPVVAVTATAMNLLSVGAAYGVVALFASGGTLGRLVGIDTDTPVPAFIPVLMFAALFGLSMDYQVFLLSRIREEHLAGGDARRAVWAGLARTARVITVAALIMTVVFVAFAFDPDVFVKLAGIGLAVAVAVDATVIRLVVVPAVMQLLGERNWWTPPLLRR